MSLKMIMLNLGTWTYNSPLLLGKLYGNTGMLKIIKNKMKNKSIPHCKSKFWCPVLFSSFISDLLVTKDVPLANTQLTVNAEDC